MNAERSALGQPVYAYDSVGSTMDEAHRLAADGVTEGTLVVALRQEQGRGRLGRVWTSPEGGAYCSMVLRPKRQTAAPQLSLVTGLAAAETIRDVACLYPSIRWPNDLLLNGKKVGGILVEARNGAVVVGIGTNVSTDPAQLPDGSTSLAAEGAAHVSREDVIAGLCRRLSAWYDVWTAEGFAPIREALRPWMGHFGQPVRINTSAAGPQSTPARLARSPGRAVDSPLKNLYEGVAQDLDEEGRLVVRLDAGVLRAFEVGEVTLLR